MIRAMYAQGTHNIRWFEYMDELTSTADLVPFLVPMRLFNR